MNELLKARAQSLKLISGTASLLDSMVALNTRMDALKKTMEETEREEQAAKVVDEPCYLLELPEDLLCHILRQTEDHRALCATSMSCRTLAEVAGKDAAGWTHLCRADWNCFETEACNAPRMETCSRVMERYDDEVCQFMEDNGIYNAEEDERWKEVYRDRVLGWSLVTKTLKWLSDHHSPSEVSGRQHRFELFTALLYLDMTTSNVHRITSSRKEALREVNGLVSVIALMDNETAMVQELAASVIANLSWRDPDVQRAVRETANGPALLGARLDSRIPSVIQQVARALATLWGGSATREVTVVQEGGEAAVPLLQSGLWVCREYSLRGEVEGGEGGGLLHLSFSDDGSFIGAGGEEEGEEYDLLGKVEVGESEEWSFSKVYCRGGHRVNFLGHTDCFGAYGTYLPEGVSADAQTFVISSERAPKVFRLCYVGEGQEVGLSDFGKL